MPWIFVVDGNGIVRAKYTGIVGSADIDVILTQIKAEQGRPRLTDGSACAALPATSTPACTRPRARPRMR